VPFKSDRTRRLLAQASALEAGRIGVVLRRETVGGGLLLFAAAVALALANSPWADQYEALRAFSIGPSALHLDLSLGTWAADGLLAIFFFVAGLELKREFVAGDLRDPSRALLPVAAAVGGVVLPALIYLMVNSRDGGAIDGWAIPTATDIAFALAVLAVVGRHLPPALRIFLLTLAVVDDLIAIIIIALFYSGSLVWPALVGAALAITAFGFLVRGRWAPWWLLVPLAVVSWAFVHESGIHATIAGVALALTVPVRPTPTEERANRPGLAEHMEHRLRPLSAGLAVPVFAFMAAGTAIGGLDGVSRALGDPAAVGIILGLVVGKPVGVFVTTWLVARFTRAELDVDLTWTDVSGVALLSGVGFTVSLLIGELAFADDQGRAEHATLAVLVGSVAAAAAASVILASRSRAYRRIEESHRGDSSVTS
jgi:NhaA family Na+:H+ antiporter